MKKYQMDFAKSIINLMPFTKDQKIEALAKVYKFYTGDDIMEILEVDGYYCGNLDYVTIRDKKNQSQSGATDETDTTINMF